VTTTTDRDQEVLISAESDRGRDVFRVERSNDKGRPPVEQGAPDAASGVVLGVVGTDDLSIEGRAEPGERRRGHGHGEPRRLRFGMTGSMPWAREAGSRAEVMSAEVPSM
jgi:hypothetical protein